MKKSYLLAIVCCFATPVVLMCAGVAYRLIDPEMAAGHANYERNFRLLTMLQFSVVMGAFLLAGFCWLATGGLLLYSKRRSPWFLPLTLLGPFGFALISFLDDSAPSPDDRYRAFLYGMRFPWRIGYEVGLFFSIAAASYHLMILKREAMILYRSAVTGMSVAEIRAEQLASSGMWAFGESLEVLFLFVVIYLLIPLCYNAAARRWRADSSSRT